MPATWPLEKPPDLLPLLEPLELTSHAEPAPTPQDDGTPGSLSLSFRHSGWRIHREAINAAFRRTMQSVSRIAAFQSCGSHSYVLRSVLDPDFIRLAGST